MPEVRSQIPGLNYPASLDDLWAKHHLPRDPHAPTVLSTFAGTGGSSLGYSAAGFRELLAVEWDAHAVECFRLNFPDVPVYHGDIAALSVDEVLARTGLKPGELDVFDSSPPCQGFSTSGLRRIDDPRNQLFREAVRLLKGLRPKVFVMENVSGQVKGHMKLVFAEILDELEGAGYRVSARLLNAKYFGVPQSRERMIYVGTRGDLNITPTHPAPVGPAITVKQAWRGIEQERGDALKGPALAVASYCLPGTSNGGGRVSKWLRGTTAGFSLTRLSWNRPSCTIPKFTALSSTPIVHPDRNERISLNQCKRVCSFPDAFQLPGSFTEAWGRLGNSVPPMFMYHIARHIRAAILDQLGVADGK